MPLYEYTCGECERPFELLVSSPVLADSVVCRHCGSESVRRLVSSFAARSMDSSRNAMEAITARGNAGGGGCACGGGGCGCGR